MYRTTVRILVLVLALGYAAPVQAGELEDGASKRPAADNRRRPLTSHGDNRRGESSPVLKGLFVAYSGLSGLDMYSTIRARDKGAREINPLLNTD